MNDAQPHWILRTATTVLALALAFGVNAAAAYTMGGSGTPNGRPQHLIVADLGTLPGITVRACRVSG